MKKLIKIFVFLLLFLISYTKVYALDEIKTCSYEIKNTDYGKIIIGVDEKTYIYEFLSKLNISPEFLKVYGTDGEELEYSALDIMKTGMIIEYDNDNNVIDKVTVVVRGDVNSDGYINISDKIILQEHLQDIQSLSGIFINSIDLDNNSIIDESDNKILSNYILLKDGIELNNNELICGAGTKYNKDHTDGEYAVIDGKDGLPGYFTLKQ